MEPTYYRHRNDDYKPEIVVRAWTPDEGDLWGLTVTDEDGIDPRVAVHVCTGQFAAHALFGEFFRALAERAPGTLDEVASLLDALGVANETADRERRRAQSAAAWCPEDDTWPHL